MGKIARSALPVLNAHNTTARKISAKIKFVIKCPVSTAFPKRHRTGCAHPASSVPCHLSRICRSIPVLAAARAGSARTAMNTGKFYRYGNSQPRPVDFRRWNAREREGTPGNEMRAKNATMGRIREKSQSSNRLKAVCTRFAATEIVTNVAGHANQSERFLVIWSNGCNPERKAACPRAVQNPRNDGAFISWPPTELDLPAAKASSIRAFAGSLPSRQCSI